MGISILTTQECSNLFTWYFFSQRLQFDKQDVASISIAQEALWILRCGLTVASIYEVCTELFTMCTAIRAFTMLSWNRVAEKDDYDDYRGMESATMW